MSIRQDDFDPLANAAMAAQAELVREAMERGMSRRHVQQMCEHAELLHELRCPERVTLDAGFTARVMARIEADKPASIWDLFVSPLLAKQLTFASLVLMAMLAGFLFARSSEQAMLSQHTEQTLIRVEHPENLGLDPQRDRQNMLATLASYRGEE
ncbi:MAG: hypothetical protein KIT83_11755 [Bryobacterales bacterium]|nr:hypothetical protein [Bryobacterales bacterium]